MQNPSCLKRICHVRRFSAFAENPPRSVRELPPRSPSRKGRIPKGGACLCRRLQPGRYGCPAAFLGCDRVQLFFPVAAFQTDGGSRGEVLAPAGYESTRSIPRGKSLFTIPAHQAPGWESFAGTLRATPLTAFPVSTFTPYANTMPMRLFAPWPPSSKNSGNSCLP